MHLEQIEAEIAPLMSKLFLQTLKEALGGKLTRKKSDSDDFHSVREYFYGGDDARSIQWKISSKWGKPHVVQNKQLHEASVYLILDSSGSIKSKQKHLKLVSYFFHKVLASLKSGLGLFWGASKISGSHFFSLKEGEALLHLLEEMQIKGESNLEELLLEVSQKIRGQNTLIIVTDLISFEQRFPILQALAKRNQILLVHLSSKLDYSLPDVGYMHLKNPEDGKTIYVNLSDEGLRAEYQRKALNKLEETYKTLFSQIPSMLIWQIWTDELLQASVGNLLCASDCSITFNSAAPLFKVS